MEIWKLIICVGLQNTPQLHKYIYFSPHYCISWYWIFKGTLHPKLKILSSFTHPQVFENLCEFLSSAEHKGRYFEEWLEQNSCLARLP